MVAWFPLNETFHLEEINYRVPNPESKSVSLAPGPDGRQGGSYELEHGHIKFLVIEDGTMDVRDSITILFWLCYTSHRGGSGIVQYLNQRRSRGMGIFVSERNGLQACIVKRDISKVYTLKVPSSAGSWTFVAITFNQTSGEAKLWINAVVANETAIKEDCGPITKRHLKIGGHKFKGRITQLRIYNYPLTKEKITEINETFTILG